MEKMGKKEIKIGKKTIDNNSVFFIVEEGQLNQGDFAKAKQMIDLTAETGADAIEFQFAITEDFYIKNHRGFAIYEKVQFTFVQMIELVKYSISKNLEFIVAPLSHNLIEPLKNAGVSAFNINASDISNPQMLDSVAKSGLPYFISLPLADETEIEWAINRIGKINPNYILLQGQHSMASGEHGVKPMHSSLGYIETLKNKYNGIAGYIDHSPLTWMPSCAVAAGANVISKHLCISHNDKGPDWQVCLEPEEMKQAISFAREISQSINTKEKVLAPGENMDKTIMRRSIVSTRKISANEIISANDIAFKRPGGGIPPSDYEKVIGKIAKIDIENDTTININDLK